MSALSSLLGLFGRRPAMKRIFAEIYRTRRWGGVSASGPGSDLVRTAELRKALPDLVRRLGVRTVLDAPCGDFFWMKELVGFAERYIGVDVVPDIVEANRRSWPAVDFRCLDITTEDLPPSDLILCRDGLVHLSYAGIYAALARFRKSGARWLFATTFPDHDNADIPDGNWRPLNLEKAPFSFPKASFLLNEGCPELRGEYRDKSLGLWRIEDLTPTTPRSGPSGSSGWGARIRT